MTRAERFDPATLTWGLAAPMVTEREFHTATRLEDGRVLVVGGRSKAAILASVHVYDPKVDKWASAPSLKDARELHTATLLLNGTVLVAGGRNGASVPTAEIYDPASNSWTQTQKPLVAARYAHTATLLKDGRVLAAAGFGAAILSSAELYDPASGTWADTDALTGARDLHTATLLSDGRVLIAGGFLGGNYLKTTEIYAAPSGGIGSSCSVGAGCQSGFCVDGFCCNADCGGVCEACSAGKKGSGANGFCGAIALGADPDSECAAQSVTTCGTTGACNGAGACQLHPNGTECAAGSCAGNTAVNADLCDGKGTCVDGGSQPCGGGTCVSGSCQSVACSTDVACAPAGYCNGKVCIPKQPLGTDCQGPNQCQTGFCADGLCCDTACSGGLCDACSVPAGATTDGTCTPLNGVVCDDGNACTLSDSCQGGACSSASAVVCMPEVCAISNTCDTLTGQCVTKFKLDGAPCDGGQCIAGGCVPDTVPGPSNGEGGGSGSSDAGSSNGGGGAGVGAESVSSSVSGSGAGGGGVGGAEEKGEIRLRGGACSAAGGEGSGAVWIGIGLLLGARARRRRRVGR